MGRRPIVTGATNWASVTIIIIGLISCTLAYYVITNALKPSNNGTHLSKLGDLGVEERERSAGGRRKCCRGIPNLELWGSAVKWGTNHRFNTSEECCNACKGMCSGNDGPCLCDSWVFCGNKTACGAQFGECWLKKQKDTLAPERQAAGSQVMWTSGIIFGKGEGIIGLETDHGVLRIELHPDCAPQSVSYIIELLGARLCAGCQFYRAEGRGDSWDVKGNHINDASFGPPFALIQGTLEAAGVSFSKIPAEGCLPIQRGSVAWVGSGPEFFISLANHFEWKNSYTVFGSVLPQDMHIAEKIAQLPTKPDVWNNINVSVLENPVEISTRRI